MVIEGVRMLVSRGDAREVNISIIIMRMRIFSHYIRENSSINYRLRKN